MPGEAGGDGEGLPGLVEGVDVGVSVVGNGEVGGSLVGGGGLVDGVSNNDRSVIVGSIKGSVVEGDVAPDEVVDVELGSEVEVVGPPFKRSPNAPGMSRPDWRRSFFLNARERRA